MTLTLHTHCLSVCVCVCVKANDESLTDVVWGDDKQDIDPLKRQLCDPAVPFLSGRSEN